jgi:hypothetical protein
MLFGRSEDAQSRSVGGCPSSLDIEFFAQPANKLRLVVDNWEHSAKEKQVARLYRLDVGAKRRRGGWELNAKVEQPALCGSDDRVLDCHTWLLFLSAFTSKQIAITDEWTHETSI